MKIPAVLGEPTEEPVVGPVMAPQTAAWFDGPQLRFVLGHAFDALKFDGRLDAVKVAAALGVSAGTVRRWGRTHLAEPRRAGIMARIAVSDLVHEQEAVQLRNARENAATLGLKGVKAADWIARGWTEPHVLYLVFFPRLGVWIPRIGKMSEKSLTRVTAGAGGGVIIRRKIFTNHFEALCAKFETLRACQAWRIALPEVHGSQGLQRLQGSSSAVLAACPVPISLDAGLGS
ncbi:hypothetical protein [Arthrobacter cryoconiti]|uniref:Transcriptional regulator n=1 Tax=Arthrobacter cryoconiti TaxID=748907 RepID=A0ABV8R4H8_9MICC|nr:hypothetical protein [Arthrobacter cryoconiti]MCC9069446.1 hypothetical protein [Arthrobacter cryoconiti]